MTRCAAPASRVNERGIIISLVMFLSSRCQGGALDVLMLHAAYAHPVSLINWLGGNKAVQLFVPNESTVPAHKWN